MTTNICESGHRVPFSLLGIKGKITETCIIRIYDLRFEYVCLSSSWIKEALYLQNTLKWFTLKVHKAIFHIWQAGSRQWGTHCLSMWKPWCHKRIYYFQEKKLFVHESRACDLIFVIQRARSLSMKGFTSVKELNLGLTCTHLIISKAYRRFKKKSIV